MRKTLLIVSFCLLGCSNETAVPTAKVDAGWTYGGAIGSPAGGSRGAGAAGGAAGTSLAGSNSSSNAGAAGPTSSSAPNPAGGTSSIETSGVGGANGEGGSAAGNSGSTASTAGNSGSSASTGGSGSGGALTTGGTSSASGSVTGGGRAGNGGSTSGKGGSSAAGGVSGTGGVSTTGGVSRTGGSLATGGTTAAGGAIDTGYHQLVGWASDDETNPNQHGRAYFISNGQKDDQDIACTSCHGANLEGKSGPSCNSCHSTWRSTCTFCHGTGPSQINPPRGIYDESSTGTLAVGRHVAHLSAGASHAAFACTTCHIVPASNDVSHTLPFKHAPDLSTAGHEGTVTFSGSALIWNGTTWTVTATSGTPVSARGTCTGGCHSNGRGGAPAKTPYWAGGSWTTGCANCHGNPPSTGHHRHAIEEGAKCADCHSGATSNSYASASHMNGKRDHLGTVAGQSMTLTDSGTGVRCSGTCHGNNEGHNGTW